MASPSMSAATPQPGFALDALIFSGPRESRASRRLPPAVLSVALHLAVVAAIVILPLVVGDQVLPATTDAVREPDGHVQSRSELRIVGTGKVHPWAPVRCGRCPGWAATARGPSGHDA